VETFHKLSTLPFSVYYVDPIQGDLLPINNDDNLAKAITCSKSLLRLVIQRKGKQIYRYLIVFFFFCFSSHSFIFIFSKTKIDKHFEDDYFSGKKKNNFLNNLIPSSSVNKIRPQIGLPQDFREVSSIIDVDVVPETCRRVKLVKHGSDKPLGFYIRDGTSVRVLPHGLEKVPGVFISRLVPGGIAEGTGLVAINDEILEVNGIEVFGKTLDQVTDMMIANSSNLIITIRPANQRNSALLLNPSLPSISDDEEDEIKDHSYFS